MNDASTMQTKSKDNKNDFTEDSITNYIALSETGFSFVGTKEFSISQVAIKNICINIVQKLLFTLNERSVIYIKGNVLKVRTWQKAIKQTR